MKRLSSPVIMAVFCALTQLAVNTAFSIDADHTHFVARNSATHLLKVSGKIVFLEGEEGAATIKQNIDTQGVILKGCDVVAYFKDRKPVKGSSEWSSTYQGATYLFASAANKAEFDKDPSKYVPQYGGFCAYGVSLGVLADPEGPGAFLVYRGKLYVCGNQGALKDFKKDIDNNIDKANTNWRKLSSQ